MKNVRQGKVYRKLRTCYIFEVAKEALSGDLKKMRGGVGLVVWGVWHSMQNEEQVDKGIDWEGPWKSKGASMTGKDRVSRIKAGGEARE